MRRVSSWPKRTASKPHRARTNSKAITQWPASLKDFRSPAGADSEPEDVAKVTRKLDAARLKLAKENGK
jgi:hypothetical protein